MKTKVLALFISLIMIISLFACSDGKIPETPAESKETQSDSIKETVKETEPGTSGAETVNEDIAETTVAEETKAEIKETENEFGLVEDPKLLHPYTKILHEGGQDDGNRIIYTMDTQFVYLDEEEQKMYPELDTALREDLNNFVSLSAEEGRNIITDYYDEDLVNAEWFDKYESNINAKLGRTDENFFSVMLVQSGYYGGAHGSYSVLGFNYSTQTGRPITPSDVFISEEAFIDELTRKLEADREQNSYFEEDLEKFFQETYKFDSVFMADTITYSMVLGYEGVDIIFSPYEIAPWATGTITVSFPYDEYASILKLGMSYVPKNYIIPIGLYSGIETDEGTVTVRTWTDDYISYKKTIVDVDGNECEHETFTYNIVPWLAKTDDGLFISIHENADDDEEFFEVFKIADGKAEYSGRVDKTAYRENKEETSNPILNLNCYARSDTFSFTVDPEVFKLDDGKMYRIGTDGMPVVK